MLRAGLDTGYRQGNDVRRINTVILPSFADGQCASRQITCVSIHAAAAITLYQTQHTAQQKRATFR